MIELSRLQRRILLACRTEDDAELGKILDEYTSAEKILSEAKILRERGFLLDWKTTKAGMIALLGDDAG